MRQITIASITIVEIGHPNCNNPNHPNLVLVLARLAQKQRGPGQKRQVQPYEMTKRAWKNLSRLVPNPGVAQMLGSSSDLYEIPFHTSCRRLCPRWCRRWRWSFEPTSGLSCRKASSSRTLRRKRSRTASLWRGRQTFEPRPLWYVHLEIHTRCYGGP